MKHFFLTLALLTTLACAQVPVGVELPEGSVITLSEDKVSFELESFPPPEFPAYYTLSDPLVLRLYSNVSGSWTLEGDLGEGLVTAGGLTIPAAQLEYRLDGGLWFALAPRVVLLSGQGVSEGFESHSLELRLKLVGNERPGLYQGILDLSLIRF